MGASGCFCPSPRPQRGQGSGQNSYILPSCLHLGPLVATAATSLCGRCPDVLCTSWPRLVLGSQITAYCHCSCSCGSHNLRRTPVGNRFCPWEQVIFDCVPGQDWLTSESWRLVPLSLKPKAGSSTISSPSPGFQKVWMFGTLLWGLGKETKD